MTSKISRTSIGAATCAALDDYLDFGGSQRGPTGDLSGAGHVDGAELGMLLGAWGSIGGADLTGDGVVAGADLGVLLGNWG